MLTLLSSNTDNMKEFEYNRLIEQKVAKEILNEISKHTGETLEQIAKSCQIDPRQLHHAIASHHINIPSQLVTKLIHYYCYICYDQNGYLKPVTFSAMNVG